MSEVILDFFFKIVGKVKLAAVQHPGEASPSTSMANRPGMVEAGGSWLAGVRRAFDIVPCILRTISRLSACSRCTAWTTTKGLALVGLHRGFSRAAGRLSDNRWGGIGQCEVSPSPLVYEANRRRCACSSEKAFEALYQQFEIRRRNLVVLWGAAARQSRCMGASPGSLSGRFRSQSVCQTTPQCDEGLLSRLSIGR